MSDQPDARRGGKGQPSSPRANPQRAKGGSSPKAPAPGAKGGKPGSGSGGSGASATKSGTAVKTRPAAAGGRPATNAAARRAAQSGAATRRRASAQVLPLLRDGAWTHGGTLAIAIGLFLMSGVMLPDLATHFAFHTAVLLVLGVAGLPLLALRAWGVAAQGRPSTEVWAARAGVALIVVSLISSFLSSSLRVAVFGTYLTSAGLLFTAAIVGCWALGTGVATADRDLVEKAIIAAAAVNSVIAILQQFFGLGSIGLADYNGLPDGVQGNPVFMGALVAGALALLGPRVAAAARKADPTRDLTVWLVVTAVVGIGLGMCSERFPAVLAVLVVAWVVWCEWRRRRREATEDGGQGGTSLRFSVMFAAVAVGALLLGSVVAWLDGGTGTVKHVASSTAQETYGERFHTWAAAFDAFLHHPLFGVGPGQFYDATSAHYSLAFVVSSQAILFTDAHGILFEFLGTTGILGLASLVAMVWFGWWRRSGPLVACSIVLFASQMVEPLNPVITPLAMFAMGAAAFKSREPAEVGNEQARGPRRSLPPWLRVATIAAAVVAAIPAVLLVVGDIEYSHLYSPKTEPSVSAEKAAYDLLPWADPATELSNIYATQVSSGVPGAAAEAIHWAKAAVSRDPGNGNLWAQLARLQLLEHEIGPATASVNTALREVPYDAEALVDGGFLAAIHHDRALAEYDLSTSLIVDPDQPQVKNVLKDLKEGCTATAQLRLVCPPAKA